jgi:hypothetical protein
LKVLEVAPCRNVVVVDLKGRGSGAVADGAAVRVINSNVEVPQAFGHLTTEVASGAGLPVSVGKQKKVIGIEFLGLSFLACGGDAGDLTTKRDLLVLDNDCEGGAEGEVCQISRGAAARKGNQEADDHGWTNLGRMSDGGKIIASGLVANPDEDSFRELSGGDLRGGEEGGRTTLTLI